MEDLRDILNLINKKYGKDTINFVPKIAGLKVERIPTGIFSLDIELGGGIPLGRMIEIYGAEQTGKSTLAMNVIREFQKRGKSTAYIDAEGVFDPAWAKKIGVNVDKLLLSKPETGEITADILDSLVRSNKIDLIIVDSVAAMIPQADLETSMVDPERIGSRAQLVNRIIRKLHSALNIIEDGVPNNSTIILINQIRMKIGVYGNPETTTGGRGLKFGASVRLELRTSKYIKNPKDGRIIGREVKFKVVKNKTYPSYKAGFYSFYLNGAIDNKELVMLYGILYELIKQTGNTFTYENKECVGKKKLYKLLELEDIRELSKQIKKLTIDRGYDIAETSNKKEDKNEKEEENATEISIRKKNKKRSK